MRSCARVETLDGDDVLAQLVPIEEEWRSLTPLVGDGPEAVHLGERFARAVAACRKRHEMGALMAETRAAYEALVSEAEGLLSNEDSTARWQPAGSPSIARRAATPTSLSQALRPEADLDARLAAVRATLSEREAARDAERREAAATDSAERACSSCMRLTERARRASEAEPITLREGDRLLRDIGAGLEESAKIESSREIGDAAAALRKLQEARRAARARAARDGRLAPVRQRAAPGTAHRDGRSHRRVAQGRSRSRARPRTSAPRHAR